MEPESVSEPPRKHVWVQRNLHLIQQWNNLDRMCAFFLQHSRLNWKSSESKTKNSQQKCLCFYHRIVLVYADDSSFVHIKPMIFFFYSCFHGSLRWHRIRKLQPTEEHSSSHCKFPKILYDHVLPVLFWNTKLGSTYVRIQNRAEMKFLVVVGARFQSLQYKLCTVTKSRWKTVSL